MEAPQCSERLDHEIPSNEADWKKILGRASGRGGAASGHQSGI
jgi:hypothetical protein